MHVWHMGAKLTRILINMYLQNTKLSTGVVSLTHVYFIYVYILD